MIAKLSGMDAGSIKEEDNKEVNSPFGALGELLKNKK